MNTKHVTSLEIAKQLAEAGIVIESEFWWVEDNPEDWVLVPKGWTNIEMSRPKKYPAPIATELLEIMPAVLKVTDTGVGLNDYACLEIQKYCSGEKIYGVLYSLGEDIAYYKEVGLEEYSPTLPDALALLLIRLTKDGLI